MKPATHIFSTLCLISAVLQLMFTANTYGDTVYKSTDKNGNIVFSDEPSQNSKKVELTPITTINLHTPKQFKAYQPSTSRLRKIKYSFYDSLKITSPLPEASLVNTGGIATINVNASPALVGNHQFRLLINDEVKGTQRSSRFSLTDVYRGSHKATVQIVSSDGKIVKESSPVTFHVHQHSIRRN